MSHSPTQRRNITSQSASKRRSATRQLAGKKLAQPTLFIAGVDDHFLEMIGIRQKEQIAAVLRRGTNDLRGVHLIPDCRHFVHMEKASETNQLILNFLKTVTKVQRSNDE